MFRFSNFSEHSSQLTQADVEASNQDWDGLWRAAGGVETVPGNSPAQNRLYNRQAIQDAYDIPAPHRVSGRDEISYYRNMLSMPQFRQVNIGAYLGYLANYQEEVV